MSVHIQSIVNELRPFLLEILGNEWDLVVDCLTDNIRLVGQGYDEEILTRVEIDDNVYKVIFAPRLLEVKENGSWIHEKD